MNFQVDMKHDLLPHKGWRWRRLVLYGLLGMAVGQGQTKIDLQTQTQNVDFTQASATKPIKAGTVLPAVCNVSELFYKTNAVAGQNLFGCTGTNTWTLLGDGGSGGGGGGGSVSSYNNLTDLQVTLLGSTFSVAPGKTAFGDVTTSFLSATLIESDTNDTGTIYFCADLNAGNPQLLAVIPAVFTEANYAPAGMVVVDGTGCPEDTRVLATAEMSNGAPQFPVDQRAAMGLGAAIFTGSGLLKTVTDSGRSRTISVDSASVVQKFLGAEPPGSILGSTLGDMYVDTAAEKAYLCMNAGGDCNGVSAGQWVVLN